MLNEGLLNTIMKKHDNQCDMNGKSLIHHFRVLYKPNSSHTQLDRKIFACKGNAGGHQIMIGVMQGAG